MTFHRVSQHTLMAAALAASIVFAGCATHRAPAQPANLAAAAMQESELSTFNQLVQQAGMQDALQGSAPMTVFAPTNNAFAAALSPVQGAWGEWRAKGRAAWEASFDLPPQPSPVDMGVVMAHLRGRNRW